MKRLLAIMLVLSMVLAQMPMSIFAEEANMEEDSAEVLTSQTEDSSLTENEEPEPEEPVEIEPEETQSEETEPEETEQTEPEETEETEATEPEETEETEATEPEETEETEPEETEEELFTGMPEDYVLTQREAALKQNQEQHNMADAVEALIPDVDYLDGQLLFIAGNQEKAEMVAQAYDAELISFHEGLATIQLTNATVGQAMAVSADTTNNMVPVEPNYLYRSASQTAGSIAPMASNNAEGKILNKQNWESWVEAMVEAGYEVDPLLSTHFDSDIITNIPFQYQHSMMNTFAAWPSSTGNYVRVGIVSTGLNEDEDVLSGNRNVTAMSACEPYSDHSDPTGRGTALAQIIGGTMGNGYGGVGVAPDTDLLSIRVRNQDGYIDSQAIMLAMMTLAGYDSGTDRFGASPVDVALLGYYAPFYDAYEEWLLQKIVEGGATVVVAAGDYAASDMKSYPAGYNAGNGMIVVGAVNMSGTRYAMSSTSKKIEIWAPGENILVANGSDSRFESSTVIAAGMVAGACALYKQGHPDAAPAQVEAAVKSAVSKHPVSGTMILDVSKMFTAAPSAPTIRFEEGVGTTAVSVPFGGLMSISVPNPEGCTILYTTDGKAPAVKNGVVTHGMEYTEPVAATPENGFAVGKAVKVMAICVSGQGVASKASTVTVTVQPEMQTSVSIAPITQIIAGKAVNLIASVEPADTASQAVKWEIVNGAQFPHATISAAGKLTTAAQDGAGTIEIRAYAQKTNGETVASEILSIPVTTALPVYSMALSPASTTLYFSSNATEMPTQLQLVPTLKDSKKGEIDPETVTLRWTSSNQKVATVDQNGNVTATGKGSAKITCAAMDGSGKKVTASVTVKQLAESVTISGQQCVTPGTSPKFTASVQPAAANNKAVTWQIVSGGEYATMKNGVLTVSKTAPVNVFHPETITIRATTADGSQVWTELELPIREKTTSVAVAPSGATVQTRDLDYTDGLDNEVTLTATVQPEFTDTTPLKWTVDKPNLAEIIPNGYECTVVGKAPGKVIVTCAAQDGSGKKASAKITVSRPASSMTLTSNITPAYSTKDSGTNQGFDFTVLGYGISAKHKVAFGSDYGKPTNTKVYWDAWIDVYNDYDGSYYTTISGKSYITISQKGVVKVNPNIQFLNTFNGEYYTNVLRVYAAAVDGSGLEAIYNYRLETPVSKISPSATSVTLYNQTISAEGLPDVAEVNLTTWHNYYEWKIINHQYYYGNCTWYGDAFIVTSSNPDVASAMRSDTEWNRLVICAGTKPGKAVITIKSTDGSNKSAKITVYVK